MGIHDYIERAGVPVCDSHVDIPRRSGKDGVVAPAGDLHVEAHLH